MQLDKLVKDGRVPNHLLGHVPAVAERYRPDDVTPRSAHCTNRFLDRPSGRRKVLNDENVLPRNYLVIPPPQNESSLAVFLGACRIDFMSRHFTQMIRNPLCENSRTNCRTGNRFYIFIPESPAHLSAQPRRLRSIRIQGIFIHVHVRMQSRGEDEVPRAERANLL